MFVKNHAKDEEPEQDSCEKYAAAHKNEFRRHGLGLRQRVASGVGDHDASGLVAGRACNAAADKEASMGLPFPSTGRTLVLSHAQCLRFHLGLQLGGGRMDDFAICAEHDDGKDRLVAQSGPIKHSICISDGA